MAEGAKSATRWRVGRSRSTISDSGFGQRFRTAFEHAQQIDEGEVLAQTLRKRHPPVGGVDVPVDGLAEEDLMLGADVALDRGVRGVVHPRGQILTREQGAADDRAAEEFVDALPDLADDCVGLEGLIEDARYVVEQLLAAIFASNRGRGAGDIARGPVTRGEYSKVPLPPAGLRRLQPL